MAKFFLLSIIIAMIVLPARAARIKDPKLGLRKLMMHMAVFCGLYAFGLVYLYQRSGSIHAVYMAGIVLLYRYI
jgi:NADH:ubiquinone oxidoreductase subunit 3 (subunit A)